jgi:hypothetical protein
MKMDGSIGIRWQQRFDNYSKAHKAFREAIELSNQPSQTYNKKVADDIVHKIRTSYAPRFQELFVKLKSLVS